MVVLKKIKAATLVETLVASVIIVIVFMIASLSLNNIFIGTAKSNDTPLQSRIKELCYLNEHNQISIPFYEDNDHWEITIEKQGGTIVLFSLSKKNSHNKQQVIAYDTL